MLDRLTTEILTVVGCWLDVGHSIRLSLWFNQIAHRDQQLFAL